jgi:glycosyltransferase involved in cell wall biosynthesis
MTGPCNGKEFTAVTVAVNMIVYNAARFLGRCLDSVLPWVDEVVVGLDNKTDDETAVILDDYGIAYHTFVLDGFDIARNGVLSRTKSDWVLSIDADETIRPDHGPMLARLAARGQRKGIDAWVLNTRNWYDLEMNNEYTYAYPDPHIRFFRNNGIVRWDGRVHERIVGVVKRAQAAPVEIQHFNMYYRSKHEWDQVNKLYEDLGAAPAMNEAANLDAQSTECDRSEN